MTPPPIGSPSLVTHHVLSPAPSLHGRYPLPRYYGRVRLPPAPNTAYAFAASVGLGRPLPRQRTSQVPLPLHHIRAVLKHPGPPHACFRSLLPRELQASPQSAGWPRSRFITGPNQIRLRYGSHARFPRLRHRWLPRTPLVGYMSHEQLHGWDSHPARETRLSLAH